MYKVGAKVRIQKEAISLIGEIISYYPKGQGLQQKEAEYFVQFKNGKVKVSEQIMGLIFEEYNYILDQAIKSAANELGIKEEEKTDVAESEPEKFDIVEESEESIIEDKLKSSLDIEKGNKRGRKPKNKN